jgi:hypothetical protein
VRYYQQHWRRRRGKLILRGWWSALLRGFLRLKFPPALNLPQNVHPRRLQPRRPLPANHSGRPGPLNRLASPFPVVAEWLRLGPERDTQPCCRCRRRRPCARSHGLVPLDDVRRTASSAMPVATVRRISCTTQGATPLSLASSAALANGPTREPSASFSEDVVASVEFWMRPQNLARGR